MQREAKLGSLSRAVQAFLSSIGVLPWEAAGAPSMLSIQTGTCSALERGPGRRPHALPAAWAHACVRRCSSAASSRHSASSPAALSLRPGAAAVAGSSVHLRRTLSIASCHVVQLAIVSVRQLG